MLRYVRNVLSEYVHICIQGYMVYYQIRDIMGGVFKKGGRKIRVRKKRGR